MLAVIPVAALAVLVTLTLSGSAQSLLLADPGALVRWAGPVLGAANHLAAAVVLGTLALMLGVLPYRGGSAPVWRRAATILAWSAPAWTLVNLADVLMRYSLATGREVGGQGYGQELAYYLSELSAGRASLLSTVLIALAAVVAAGVTSYRGAVTTAVPAFAVLVPWSVRGHASSAADHDLAIGAMWLHLVAVAVWVGGLVVLCLVAHLLKAHAATVVRRYSAVALWCFVAVGVSGLASGWIRLNGLGDLAGQYGGLLLTKTVLFAALGLIGWWHRGRTITALEQAGARGGAFWRLAGGETLLMGAVTGVAAVLAITPTPVPDALPHVPAPAEDLSGRPVPPPPEAGTWLSQVDPDVLLAAAVVALAGLYLAGVRRFGQQAQQIEQAQQAQQDSQADHNYQAQPWPRRRTAAFLTGVVLLGWTVLGGPAVYGQLMFSAHMVALLTITLVVPALWALGAPVTLALQTLPQRPDDSRGPREYLLLALDSRWGRFWAQPVVTTATLALSMVLFHGTRLFDLALTTHIGLVLMVIHFSVVGYLFVTIFLPTDPALTRATGGRPAPASPVVLAVVALGLLVVAVVVLAAMDRLLAADHFGALGLPWGVDALVDQRSGALVLGLLGGIPLLALTAVAARAHRTRLGEPAAAVGRGTAGTGTAHDDAGGGHQVVSPPEVGTDEHAPRDEADDADERAYARMLARRERRRR